MMTRKAICASALLLAGALASFDAKASSYMECTVYRTGSVVGGCVVYFGPVAELSVSATFSTALSCNATRTFERVFHPQSLGVDGIGMTYPAREVPEILNPGGLTVCMINGVLRLHTPIGFLTDSAGYDWGIYNDEFTR